MTCGCAAPFFGPPLQDTCGGPASVLFLSLLNTLVTNTCKISEICQRITPILQPDLEYDFVIIGGGSSGSIVAGRLSEIADWKVLLIEAGSDEPAGAQIPAMAGNYASNAEVSWNYRTEPEESACLGYDGGRCDLPRGKLLGGCGAVNEMMYLRGTPKDYNNWEAEGNSGWSYEDLLPYFKKSEGNQEIGSLVKEEYHGASGPITVMRFPNQPDVIADVLDAAQELGYPISDDLCGEQYSGFALTQTNSKNGTRVSSARAFLRPARNRPNLHIMLNSTATKILVDEKKKVTGVQFIYNNTLHSVQITKEVVLSAGAINSPQLLLLSGIGPKEVLDEVEIEQIHDLPSVGQNLQNHVTFTLNMRLNNQLAITNLDVYEALNYILNQKGQMSSTGMFQVAARINSKFADPSGDDPDLQISVAGYVANCARYGEVGGPKDPANPDDKRTLEILSVALHPKSRGYINLKSNSYEDSPLIYAGYLSEAEDVAVLIDGIRVIQKLANTTALSSKYEMELEQEEYGDCATNYTFNSDEFWECAIRYSTDPGNHLAGSCKMGPSTDLVAVVDPKLQLHGIEGLRVVDASIMPTLVSASTQATCFAIAEKGAEEIKEKWISQKQN